MLRAPAAENHRPECVRLPGCFAGCQPPCAPGRQGVRPDDQRLVVHVQPVEAAPQTEHPFAVFHIELTGSVAHFGNMPDIAMHQWQQVVATFTVQGFRTPCCNSSTSPSARAWPRCLAWPSCVGYFLASLRRAVLGPVVETEAATASGLRPRNRPSSSRSPCSCSVWVSARHRFWKSSGRRKPGYRKLNKPTVEYRAALLAHPGD